MFVVALGEDAALLVECKWSTRPVGVDVLRNLEGKAPAVARELGERRLIYALCARSGFTPQVRAAARERGDLLLFDLPRIVAGE